MCACRVLKDAESDLILRFQPSRRAALACGRASLLHCSLLHLLINACQQLSCVAVCGSGSVKQPSSSPAVLRLRSLFHPVRLCEVGVGGNL